MCPVCSVLLVTGEYLAVQTATLKLNFTYQNNFSMTNSPSNLFQANLRLNVFEEKKITNQILIDISELNFKVILRNTSFKVK